MIVLRVDIDLTFVDTCVSASLDSALRCMLRSSTSPTIVWLPARSSRDLWPVDAKARFSIDDQQAIDDVHGQTDDVEFEVHYVLRRHSCGDFDERLERRMRRDGARGVLGREQQLRADAERRDGLREAQRVRRVRRRL